CSDDRKRIDGGREHSRLSEYSNLGSRQRCLYVSGNHFLVRWDIQRRNLCLGMDGFPVRLGRTADSELASRLCYLLLLTGILGILTFVITIFGIFVVALNVGWGLWLGYVLLRQPKPIT